MAQEAIHQLGEEKNELQIFAGIAVKEYNASASQHQNLSKAYDALLKVANDRSDCNNCKQAEEDLRKAETRLMEFNNALNENKRLSSV